jgi:hypothetical protein
MAQSYQRASASPHVRWRARTTAIGVTQSGNYRFTAGESEARRSKSPARLEQLDARLAATASNFTRGPTAAVPSLHRRAGSFVAQNQGTHGEYRAFVPAPLPPDPPVDLGAELREAEARAHLALGRLDGGSRYLPDPDLLLYMYIRKEAVLSSQIEGTQSSLSDLLLFESAGAPAVPTSDVEEVSRYIRAMNHGVRRLAELPLSTRLLREVHRELVTGARGGDKTPGEFRTSQN